MPSETHQTFNMVTVLAYHPHPQKRPGKYPKNYCPITCLSTFYKLITLIFTDRVYKHAVAQNILPPE
eukprot:1561198-Ditylum_brightwellii.AAC.1